MASVSCPKCRQRISEPAESCPSCQYILTREDVTRIKKSKKRQSHQQIIGFLILCVPFVVIVILANKSKWDSTTIAPLPEQIKGSTATLPHRYQPSLSEAVETQQMNAAWRGPSWFGTWSLEFIDGKPPEQHLAKNLKSDIFLSLNYTFYKDRNFDSKLLQDTGNGVLTTTTFGVYSIFGDGYSMSTNGAFKSIHETRHHLWDGLIYHTGKWSRVGNTLTLIPEAAPTKVFKLVQP